MGRGGPRQGLPLPEPQVQVFDEHGLFLGRVDAWWPEHGVVGEVDGLGQVRHSAHGVGRRRTRSAVRSRRSSTEKKREDLLRRTGLHVVRWVAADLRQEAALGADGPLRAAAGRPVAGAGAPAGDPADATRSTAASALPTHTARAG